ncbi:MAG: hypothetical protein HQ538_01625 [Parcubacteria group bacterium]|nr:hypothetical protein [Parcubacteria group bacterium]
MFKTLLIILIIVLVTTVTVYYFKIKNKGKGRSKVHRNMQEKNEMIKERIIRMFENKGRITSQDVQSTLLIEESETEGYLEELVREIRIRRMGEGDMIYYVKIEEEKKK